MFEFFFFFKIDWISRAYAKSDGQGEENLSISLNMYFKELLEIILKCGGDVFKVILDFILVYY
jgi:hypothetical protein